MSSAWQYKITAWKEEAENLNVETSRMYHFSPCELKLDTAKKSYPGQANFDVHLSSVTEIDPAPQTSGVYVCSSPQSVLQVCLNDEKKTY